MKEEMVNKNIAHPSPSDSRNDARKNQRKKRERMKGENARVRKERKEKMQPSVRSFFLSPSPCVQFLHPYLFFCFFFFLLF